MHGHQITCQAALFPGHVSPYTAILLLLPCFAQLANLFIPPQGWMISIITQKGKINEYHLSCMALPHAYTIHFPYFLSSLIIFPCPSSISSP